MAEAKKAKTAQKRGSEASKFVCQKCGTPIQVTRFAGFGPRGLFWVPEGKDCSEAGCPYPARTR